MICSYKKQFIFVKNYKVAGSSVENLIYPHLTNIDIIAQTEDYRGINSFGKFDTQSMVNLPSEMRDKYIKNQFKFFAHMPAWLIKERITPNVYNQFFKFSILRNPWDLIVSHYKWQNNTNNPNRSMLSFDQIIENIKTTHPYELINNLNRIMDLNLKEILVDQIIDFANFEDDLKVILKKFDIDFEVIPHKKKSKKTNYRDFYNNKQKDIVYKYFKKTIEIMKYEY